MKASDLLVKCLENEGVRYIFGIPGEENIDILDSLLDSKIQFIATRHEQGAAFMADVYGRLTGNAGVCLSTLGPGTHAQRRSHVRPRQNGRAAGARSGRRFLDEPGRHPRGGRAPADPAKGRE